MTPKPTQLTCVKMPKSLRDALEELAARHTASYAKGKITLDNPFADVDCDRKRLALWVPTARLVDAELKRLERERVKAMERVEE